MRDKINTAAAFLLIVAISIIAGFLLTRDQPPISDSAEYGIEALGQLKQLDQELNKEPQ